jgi:hypothetical protein
MPKEVIEESKGVIRLVKLSREQIEHAVSARGVSSPSRSGRSLGFQDVVGDMSPHTEWDSGNRDPPAPAPADRHPRILQAGSQSSIGEWELPTASAIAAALFTFALALALTFAWGFSNGGHNSERDNEGVEQLHRAVFLEYEGDDFL